MTLYHLSPTFAIHRLSPEAPLPDHLLNEKHVFISRTDDELSIVCVDELLDSPQEDADWTAFKIKGPLDFSEIGILAEISSCLAEQSIGIFCISTFDTDYILVKRDNAKKAVSALQERGHQIE